MDEWLTTTQTAELLGLAQVSIRSAIFHKKFTDDEVKKIGRDWVISREAIKRVWGK